MSMERMAQIHRQMVEEQAALAKLRSLENLIAETDLETLALAVEGRLAPPQVMARTQQSALRLASLAEQRAEAYRRVAALMGAMAEVMA